MSTNPTPTKPSKETIISIMIAIFIILSLISLSIYAIKKATNSEIGYTTPETKSEKKQKETTNQENKGYTIRDNKEKGIEVQPGNTENFKVIFPMNLKEAVRINLDNQKSIEITQKNNIDSKKITEDQIKKTTENSKLLDIIKKQPILTIYQDEKQNQTTFYTYKANTKKDEQWQFKHWTIYNNPQKQESIIYQLKNSIVVIDSNKNAKIYFDDKQGIKNKNPDFIIPKPYYLTNDGSKVDLDWTYNEVNQTLSTTFSAKKADYPIAFDPSILQTDAVVARISGRPVDLSASLDDYSPDQFSFTNQNDVGLGTIITSDVVTLTGFNQPLTATCTNCTAIARN